MKRHVPHHQISPGDLLVLEEGRWEVRAVLLGAVNQESAYEVRRLDFAPPTDSDGFATFTHVPALMVRRLIESGAAIALRSPPPRGPR